MKKSAHLLLFAFSFLFSNLLAAQKFSIKPENPVLGESTTVMYDPKGGPLEGKSFECVAFLYTVVMRTPRVIGLLFRPENEGYAA